MSFDRFGRIWKFAKIIAAFMAALAIIWRGQVYAAQTGDGLVTPIMTMCVGIALALTALHAGVSEGNPEGE